MGGWERDRAIIGERGGRGPEKGSSGHFRHGGWVGGGMRDPIATKGALSNQNGNKNRSIGELGMDFLGH